MKRHSALEEDRLRALVTVNLLVIQQDPCLESNLRTKREHADGRPRPDSRLVAARRKRYRRKPIRHFCGHSEHKAVTFVTIYCEEKTCCGEYVCSNAALDGRNRGSEKYMRKLDLRTCL